MGKNTSLDQATILQVIPDLDAGGAERTTIEVCEALRDAGARPLVVSAGGRLEEDLAAAGGELLRRASISSKNPATIRANAGWLAKLIRSETISLVHARSRAPAWSALWAARRRKTPFVTTYHGVYGARGPLKRFYNSVMARGDVVIANSNFTADHVRGAHAFAADRLKVIPRGVDLDAFHPDAVTEERLARLTRDWDAFDGVTLILPGRLTAWKGQMDAAEAAGQLMRKHTNGWRLLLVGDHQGRTGYLSDLAARVQDLGLNHRVTVRGHCRDMPAAYQFADVVMAPSREPEAFGRVAAEASAMGKPVIVSDHGGQREIVLQGETGLRVRPGDTTGLAQAMSDVIEMGIEGRRKMGAAGAKHVRARFSKTGLQAATLNVYESLLIDRA